MNIYESDTQLSQYLMFHYGTADEILPYDFGPKDALHYPCRTVHECILKDNLPPAPRSLDLGCAVGRSTFELSKFSSIAIGIDYSKAFIDAAEQIRTTGSMDYSYHVTGELTARAVAKIPPGTDASNVQFEVGDAMNLRKDLGPFHIIHMANLIDRLHDPVKCLAQLSELMPEGGQLIITTPCTWLEEFTPVENWLGGRYRAGMEITTIDGLHGVLKNNFTLHESKDMPFLIREHARKYQWSVAQASTWIRN